jgi:ABC-type glycerol-3-phosphate transport system substrate-binding protein
LFNNAEIITVPDYWDKDFQANVKKLTKQNSQGDIIQAGVALGAGTNIDRSADILMTLMMQNGAVIMKDGKITFNQIPVNMISKGYNPGMEAIRFYSDFANISKEVYSWNSNLGNSLDLFTSGKVAMFFGYSHNIPTIKSQAPKLNFAVKKMPTIKGNESIVFNNTADYWVETVSKKSKYANEAWNFLQYITTKPEITKLYLTKSQRPAALRSLIQEQENDENLGIFATQALRAKSWYQGKNYILADKFVQEMLDNIANNPENLEKEVNLTIGKIQQTVN